MYKYIHMDGYVALRVRVVGHLLEEWRVTWKRMGNQMQTRFTWGLVPEFRSLVIPTERNQDPFVSICLEDSSVLICGVKATRT